MILIPELMPFQFDVRAAIKKILEATAQSKRGAVVLVSSNKAAERWIDVATLPSNTKDVELIVQSLQEGVAFGPVVFANRYDGIDLPGDACRLLVMDGLPAGTSDYELYRASALYGGGTITRLLAQRIEQGLGRGARGAGDHCAILMVGGGLAAWIAKEANFRFLTSATRAQLEMGSQISKSVKKTQPAETTPLAGVVSDEEIAQAVHRIRGRSAQPLRDIALFYTLFATAARPLEVARLELRDYLQADGTVLHESELRVEVAITRKSRPLYFASSKLDEALSAYLGERLASGHGLGDPSVFRGLDPAGRLFLTSTGEPFPITPYGEPGQQRYLCRPILETYRKVFRYAELEGATALSVRRTFVARLYDRGADEDQIGEVLGIGERRAVREQFPRMRPTMARLVQELV